MSRVIHFLNYFKVGLISEIFSLWLHPQKLCLITILSIHNLIMKFPKSDHNVFFLLNTTSMTRFEKNKQKTLQDRFVDGRRKSRGLTKSGLTCSLFDLLRSPRAENALFFHRFWNFVSVGLLRAAGAH